jgi:hypothetical protein
VEDGERRGERAVGDGRKDEWERKKKEGWVERGVVDGGRLGGREEEREREVPEIFSQNWAWFLLHNLTQRFFCSRNNAQGPVEIF